jgi:RNA polymerase sigma factor (TIGR02999 family)
VSEEPSSPRPAPGVRGIFQNLYEELRQFAECLRTENRNLMPTIGKTDLTDLAFEKLVHEEARRRLQGRSELADKDSAAFKSCFARACHDVLVDRLRRRLAAKRGGELRREDLTEDSKVAPDHELELFGFLDELRLLGEQREQSERVVELHLLGGLTVDEIARELGVSPSQVSRELRFARAWLSQRLQKERRP